MGTPMTATPMMTTPEAAGAKVEGELGLPVEELLEEVFLPVAMTLLLVGFPVDLVALEIPVVVVLPAVSLEDLLCLVVETAVEIGLLLLDPVYQQPLRRPLVRRTPCVISMCLVVSLFIFLLILRRRAV